MATIIQNEYTGDGVTTLYSFTFPYINESDVKVSLDDVEQEPNTYEFANATQIAFDVAPADGVSIVIFRDTNVETIANTFYPGSAIRARDLNDNFTQSLYVIQEADISTTDANALSKQALETANAADAKADQAVADSAEALQEAAQASQDAAQAAQDASDAQASAEAAQEAAENAAESSAEAEKLLQVITPVDEEPTDGTIDYGQGQLPVKLDAGLRLPDENAAYAEQGALRYNEVINTIQVNDGQEWITAAGGAEVSESPPSPAVEGDIWWDPSDGRGYVYYVDADSAQWVEMNPSWNGSLPPGLVDEAPVDGNVYGRQDEAWV